MILLLLNDPSRGAFGQDGAAELQTSIGAVSQKDSTAFAIVSHGFSALGGARWIGVRDFQLSGTTLVWRGEDSSLSFTFSGRSNGQTCLSISGGDPKLAERSIYDGKIKLTISPHGAAPQTLPPHSALNQSIYLPLPMLMDILTNQAVILGYQGTTTIDGSTVDEVTVSSRSLGQLPANSPLSGLELRTLYFDHTNGFLSRISYQAYSITNVRFHQSRTIAFSDYHEDGGFIVPHTVVVSHGTVPLSHIAVSSLTINSGLSDQTFTF